MTATSQPSMVEAMARAFWDARADEYNQWDALGADEHLSLIHGMLADLQIEALQHEGGQHAGVRTGVRVTHLPTGISVTVETAGSQARNRAIALDALAGALTSPHFIGRPG